ncbi:MAG: bifunctional proline dehydrogenase/L-glutamate gamma-semialdehyde dehydrogenase PutA [Rhizobiales bacterium]|nr:bifunctional proline dehydrogenase/L-glutamate gamma-semialdehyde dehydrogenase PutA [Hyphomicrobiales bacterium]NRB14140.1 bifunctional proline dehydrogenase/L-glutamate gamma-semialdehyde dehydrogenase PutA [Hyphomicrobiales bacterium]
MSDQIKPFQADYAPDDANIAKILWQITDMGKAFDDRVFIRGAKLVNDIRKGANRFGNLEDFLREYGLSTKEGLALMCLAEALLRVPDAETMDKLIEDKLGRQNWHSAHNESSSALVSVSTWALALGSKIVAPEDTPHAIMNGVIKRLGMSSVRVATKQAMRYMGHHFVLGQNIKAAVSRAKTLEKKGYRYSYDMLGEGARTQADADKYFDSYKHAILEIGKNAILDDGSNATAGLHKNAGISIKLSALHPRYEARQSQTVLAELCPKVLELAQLAKSYNLNLTLDAEEADRLELSLDVIQSVFSHASLRGWDGFGLAIQAYSKRANQVIEWVADLCKANDAKMMVRLVKGAYWDAEIKHAQIEGARDFPVYSRKPMTDLAYMAAAKILLENSRHIYPQFATHNAATVAYIIELAQDMQLLGVDKFEFQRLHGMGDALYELVSEQDLNIPCRIYAPVGGHRDLLAYLVRRLLENGANSSFVHAIGDVNYPVEKLMKNPKAMLEKPELVRHANIKLPKDIYGQRKNSTGLEFGDREELTGLMMQVSEQIVQMKVGNTLNAKAINIYSPTDGDVVGAVVFATEAEAKQAVVNANEAYHDWSKTPVVERASIIDNLADVLEAERDITLAILCAEGGKTIDDGIAEWREAIDFCRYYAQQARQNMCEAHANEGPVGEENIYNQTGRGVFICISPWNFPLAIFLGQVAAALVTGNCVVAKPAESTPLIAQFIVDLMFKAGLPQNVLQLVNGAGDIGNILVKQPSIAGAVFTGSTATAQKINYQLATKQNAPIVPFIAETGGMNAMIVDATALPEQVTDDVINSAFKSAGQRCSALRVLYIQDDIADKQIEMIIGAAEQLKMGDPARVDTDIGPVINAAAKDALMVHIANFSDSKTLLYAGVNVERHGHFVAPHIFEIQTMADLKAEVFGPVLHIIRFKSDEIDKIITEINATGFGLTLGIHSRLDTQVQHIIDHARVGNIYVNRNMVGAVVGVQPFGGMGLSGTGPKAGGRLYLNRFIGEQVVSYNTAAAGGIASLIANSGED